VREDQVMLTEQDFAAWVARTRLSEAAQAAIAHIRRSGPSRRVGGGRSNVSGRYPSKKMGVTIQFESHRVELPAIFELEHDCSVLEYYDQVPSIKLDYRSADGNRRHESLRLSRALPPHSCRGTGSIVWPKRPNDATSHTTV
jgi:hypothetical protein